MFATQNVACFWVSKKLISSSKSICAWKNGWLKRCGHLVTVSVTLLTTRCGLRETVSNLQLTKWPFSSMVDRASVKNQFDRLLRKKSRWFGRKSTHKQFCSDYPDIQLVPFRGKVSSEQWFFLHMQPFSSTYAQPWLTTESTAYVSFKVPLRGTHADPEQSLLFECHEHAAAAWICSPRPTNLHRHQVPEKRSSRQRGGSSLCP